MADLPRLKALSSLTCTLLVYYPHE